MTQPKLIELGAPKMVGQFLTSGPMSSFNMIFFSEPYMLGYVKI